jgi:hypothetical protein
VRWRGAPSAAFPGLTSAALYPRAEE